MEDGAVLPPVERNLDTEFPFAVYGTQGGGLAKFAGNTLVWVELPKNFPEFHLGCEVPVEWDYQPANKLAREAERY